MSDTLNQLVRGPAATFNAGNAVQVNPLAAITAGNQAAVGDYQARAAQANNALGAILQQSTDPNGNVDYQDAQRRAAAAGPLVASGMQSYLTNNAQLRGAQISQAGALHTLVGNMAASLMNDPSDENLAKIRASAATQLPPGALTELDRIAALPKEQRGAEAYKHAVANIDALGQLTRGGYGTPVMTQFGGTSAPVVTTPASPYGPGGVAIGGGIAHTQDPATYYGPQSSPIMLDANGQPTNDPNKAVRSVPRDVPRGPAMGAPPPGSVGGPPGAGNQPPSAGLPPGAPPPLPGQRLVGGRFVTPPAATPPPATATPPPPNATPQPAAPTAATPSPAPPPAAPAQPPAPGGGVVTGMPTGREQTTQDLLRKDVDAQTAANTAMPDQQKRLIAGQSALDALKLADTGPSTGFVARANAFLKAQGVTTVPQGQLSDTDYRQLLQKNLLRFAQNNGQSAGTDLGLKTKLESNANADEMLAGANRHVLIQDMGILKRDIAQTQEMPEPSATGAVVKHIGSFPANTAPEAFMWNHYTKDERSAIEAQYAKDGKTQQLHDSLALAVKRGAIPDPTKPATATPPRVVAPPPPVPNALQPTAPY